MVSCYQPQVLLVTIWEDTAQDGQVSYHFHTRDFHSMTHWVISIMIMRNAYLTCFVPNIWLWINVTKLLFAYSVYADNFLSACSCYLIFNSETFFLDLMPSAQQLSNQRGVKMEVPRGRYLCIHRQFWRKKIRFCSALTSYKCAWKKNSKLVYGCRDISLSAPPFRHPSDC